MRVIISILFFLCISNGGWASGLINDSLLQVLENETLPQRRCVIYRDLADLRYDTPDEIKYLKLLVQESTKAGDHKFLYEAIGNLVVAYSVANQIDSAVYYTEFFDSMEKTEEVKGWRTYLEMCIFNMAVAEKNGTEAIRAEKKKWADQQEDDVYSRIRNAYIVANGLYTQGQYEQALTYIGNAEKLAATLRFKDGAKIHLYTIRLLARVKMRLQQFAEGIQWMEKYIELQESYYNQYYKESRPYYYINSLRIYAYATLMLNIKALPPEKADYYFQKVIDYNNKATSLYDKYSCTLIIYNYFAAKQNYTKAFAANDSLIKYASTVAQYNIPGLYKISSALYENMGKYKEALKALKVHHAMRDSLDMSKAQEHLNELQVQYDVNKLNYENSQLEIKNKEILLTCLSFFLLLLIAICTYLYKGLKKERAMKMKLSALKAKAEESEKMKTLFIRSVCHEIRTPLNAIVGFSDLLCMPDVDDDMRQCFPEEIHKNSILLTSLISRMLEVAELDVSDDKLPVESTDLHVVCIQSMERIQDRGRQGISYVLDIPETAFSMQTHTHYLMLVLENLLDNANKFTDKGEIILHYEVQGDQLLISVTDTGCGIPVEMQEKVFERFSKLDAYKPGNGLGLYLCRIIVRRLSGNIYIDPTYSQGTRVCVELPVL